MLQPCAAQQQRRRRHRRSSASNQESRRIVYLVALALLLLLTGSGGNAPIRGVDSAAAGCKLSEHRCASSGLCLAQDKFCDGENDCEDKSDEPAYCTPCNRTLYGDVGRTYELQVRRPREDKLPFLCYLNFTAAGQDLGDLVQLTFDTFTVGRFLSYTSDGCPDGYMSIREEGRPATGGQWCGSAWGYTVYYSETSSINLTLAVSRLSGQGNDYNFDFKLSYKFLKLSEAHLRYGNSSLSTWRGELVNATYCDRVFTRCDVRACRLQSPNYPGVYPRNVTCYYRIEQKRAPPGHRALLAVSQRNSHKIHIKDQNNKFDTSQRTLRVWEQCNVVQDYLTVYDGGSTTDRVLVRLCGGDSVPDIVSSRDTMLLEFHTSPYDNPFHPVPLSFLPGFELEVQVVLVDERSPASKDTSSCDLYISSYEHTYGSLGNPKHSLPPNTTCRYHFQGKPGEIVWLAFAKYHAATADLAQAAEGAAGDSAAECNVKLMIWDGPRGAAVDGAAKENATLMGEFCKDEIPRLCDHSLLRNGSRRARPCSMSESYVSSGRHLTLEHVLRQGSALYPVSFAVRYEFVQQAPASSAACDRLFSAASSASAAETRTFASPRSVFLFGRGGATNLSCTYRFETGQDKRLELAVTKASFGERSCASRMDLLVDRWSCERYAAEGIAELRLAEYPWPGIKLPRDCLCSTQNDRVAFQSLSSTTIELTFTVGRMNVTQDYQDFYFEAEYRFVPAAASSLSYNLPPAVGGQSAGIVDNDIENVNANSKTATKSDKSVVVNDNSAGGGGSLNGATSTHACHGSSHSLSDSPRLSRLEERRLRGTSGEITLRSPPLAGGLQQTVGLNTISSSIGTSSDSVAKTRLAGLATIDESLNLPILDGSSKASNAAGSSAAASEVTRCVNEPWLIEPEDSRLHFLYLKTAGFRLTPRNLDECPTRNRIIVYPASNTRDRTVVCPSEGNSSTTPRRHHSQRNQRIVDLISGGWNGSVSIDASSSQQHARSFVVEFLQQEPGYYVVTWMAISKRILSAPADRAGGVKGAAIAAAAEGAPGMPANGADCPYRCPELEACISSVLWCDGVHHCPSGFDEREENCSYRFGVTLLYVAVGAGALGIFLILLLATGCLKYCLYRRRRSHRRQMQKKLPPAASQQQQQSSACDELQQQQRTATLQKKKVQVLSVNHLNSPNNRHDNGGTQTLGRNSHQQQQQPRYANATFARIGRNMTSRYHPAGPPHHRQYSQTMRHELTDDEVDDYVTNKYSKDSIC